MQYPAHCLREREKVAAHCGIGYGDWTSPFYLLMEERRNAALRSKHVSKADRGHVGERGAQAEQYDLCYTF